MEKLSLVLNNISDAIRQWRYPREFRIPAPVWSIEDMNQLQSIIRDLTAQVPVRGSDAQAQVQAERSESLLKMAVDVANCVWRAQKALNRAPGLKELEPIRRALVATVDALKAKGVEFRDHSDEPWRDGLAIDVIEWESRADLTRDIIVETLRPSVFVEDRHVQRAQVIVGTPDEPDASTRTEGNDNTSAVRDSDEDSKFGEGDTP